MAKRLVLDRSEGVALVTADLHGNLTDFLTLEAVFEEALSRGEDWLWVGLGDWIHGPRPGRATPWAGEELYDYPDESREIVRRITSLSSRYPERFFSLLGNHEHSHVGGRVTSKYHPSEASFLEDGMAPGEVEAMRLMFASWPLIVQLPACGVILSHGAPPDTFLGPGVIDAVDYQGRCPPSSRHFLHNVLWNYGFDDTGGRVFLDRMSTEGQRYDLIIHGHDKDLDGTSPNSDHSVLLCTSFGTRRANKAYLTLDLATRYGSPEALKRGRDIHPLYPTPPPPVREGSTGAPGPP